MNIEKSDSIAEAAMLATFLGDDEVRNLAKNSKFRTHVLGQKKLIASFLKNSFALLGEEEDTKESLTAPTQTTHSSQTATATVIYKPAPRALANHSITNEQTLLQEVMAVFAEKTGYPEDMLGADLDLEADLGIDTVKQMEILGLIRKKYNLALKENFSLKQTPTIATIVSMIQKFSG